MDAITRSAGLRGAPGVDGDHHRRRHWNASENNQVRYGGHGDWHAHRPDRPNQSLCRREDRVMRSANAGMSAATGGTAHSERVTGRVVAAGAAGWFVLWLLVQSLAG
jgi:hypothetical protein